MSGGESSRTMWIARRTVAANTTAHTTAPIHTQPHAKSVIGLAAVTEPTTKLHAAYTPTGKTVDDGRRRSAGAAFEAARRRQTPAEIALLLGLTRVGVLLVAVGGLLLPVFGLWLVHLGDFGYGSAWVDAALALYVGTFALGGLGGQRPKQARLLAIRLARDRAPVSVELRALLDDRFSRAANYGSLAAVLAILALMVFR